jgi:hypothetical protein
VNSLHQDGKRDDHGYVDHEYCVCGRVVRGI